MLTDSRDEMTYGLVLHRRPYRETSMIVDFFTLQHGRMSAVVRGMRQAKSDKRSLLQPFQQLNFFFTGKSDLKTLGQVEARAKPFLLKGNSLYCGLYTNEILTRVLPQGLATEPLYKSYLQCLLELEEDTLLDTALRRFEFSLLDELGVLPDVTQTGDGDALNPQEVYCFYCDTGIEAVLSRDKSFGNYLFSGQSLIDLLNEDWNNQSRRTAKIICRQALQPFIGSKPLHSRALFKRS